MNNTIIKWEPNNSLKETVIISLNSINIVQINSISDYSAHWIKFYPDGNIEIHGDVSKAAEYIVNQCWQLFFNKDVFDKNNLVITIHGYFKIHIGDKTVTHTQEIYSPSFYQIKDVIERQVFRKLKLIAFW